jgi:phosphoglucosamine mutase
MKAFDHSGFKLPDDQELELETSIFATLASGAQPNEVQLTVDETLDQTYVNFLASIAELPLAGMKLVLDCANGGASHLAPKLFRTVGADVVHAIGASPNGRNLNLGCGALHVDSLRQEVLQRGADAGLAFDGDADRAILVSHSGKVIDGDFVLLINARDLHAAGRLKSNEGKPEVVATVMSNLGLQVALAADGIGLVRTPVGDKYVLEEMIRRGDILGGEQSGHVIFRDNATTGDGMLTALRTLEVVKKTGRDLDALTSDIKVYPQLLVNVRVSERKPLDELTAVQREIRSAEETFGNAGRVLVRFSGTEPLARVMVEGPTQEQVEMFAHRIAGAIRSELGAG